MSFDNLVTKHTVNVIAPSYEIGDWNSALANGNMLRKSITMAERFEA
jgi:hypothetical protein